MFNEENTVEHIVFKTRYGEASSKVISDPPINGIPQGNQTKDRGTSGRFAAWGGHCRLARTRDGGDINS